MNRGVARIINRLLRELWRAWANSSVNREKAFAAYRERDLILRDLGYEDYDAYLASKEWGRIRRKVLRRNKGVCPVCWFNDANVIHHMAYDMPTMAGADLTQLIGMCRECHQDIEFDGRRKRSLKEANKALYELQKGHNRFKEARKSLGMKPFD